LDISLKEKEKTPQLASSDSLDSEILIDDNKKAKRHNKRRSSQQRQNNTTPSSSSSELPTPREIENKEPKDKEIAVGVTDSATQCTMMDDDTLNERQGTRSNAVQVSLVVTDHDEADKTQQEQDIRCVSHCKTYLPRNLPSPR